MTSFFCVNVLLAFLLRTFLLRVHWRPHLHTMAKDHSCAGCKARFDNTTGGNRHQGGCKKFKRLQLDTLASARQHQLLQAKANANDDSEGPAAKRPHLLSTEDELDGTAGEGPSGNGEPVRYHSLIYPSDALSCPYTDANALS